MRPPSAFVPQAFSVQEDMGGTTPAILAWGMTLPDASAVAVDWRAGPSSVVAVCGSAERAAALFDGELVWARTAPDADPDHADSPP